MRLMEMEVVQEERGSGELDGSSTGIGGNGGNGKVILQYNQLYPTIGSNAQSAATICAGTTGQVIHSFSLTDYFSCNYVTVVGLGFTTTGTYAASDISNFKLYYTTTNSFSTANLLATNSSPTSAGTQTFFSPSHRKQAIQNIIG